MDDIFNSEEYLAYESHATQLGELQDKLFKLRVIGEYLQEGHVSRNVASMLLDIDPEAFDTEMYPINGFSMESSANNYDVAMSGWSRAMGRVMNSFGNLPVKVAALLVGLLLWLFSRAFKRGGGGGSTKVASTSGGGGSLPVGRNNPLTEKPTPAQTEETKKELEAAGLRVEDVIEELEEEEKPQPKRRKTRVVDIRMGALTKLAVRVNLNMSKRHAVPLKVSVAEAIDNLKDYLYLDEPDRRSSFDSRAEALIRKIYKDSGVSNNKEFAVLVAGTTPSDNGSNPITAEKLLEVTGDLVRNFQLSHYAIAYSRGETMTGETSAIVSNGSSEKLSDYLEPYRQKVAPNAPPITSPDDRLCSDFIIPATMGGKEIDKNIGCWMDLPDFWSTMKKAGVDFNQVGEINRKYGDKGDMFNLLGRRVLDNTINRTAWKVFTRPDWGGMGTAIMNSLKTLTLLRNRADYFARGNRSDPDDYAVADYADYLDKSDWMMSVLSNSKDKEMFNFPYSITVKNAKHPWDALIRGGTPGADNAGNYQQFDYRGVSRAVLPHQGIDLNASNLWDIRGYHGKMLTNAVSRRDEQKFHDNLVQVTIDAITNNKQALWESLFFLTADKVDDVKKMQKDLQEAKKTLDKIAEIPLAIVDDSGKVSFADANQPLLAPFITNHVDATITGSKGHRTLGVFNVDGEWYVSHWLKYAMGHHDIVNMVLRDFATDMFYNPANAICKGLLQSFSIQEKLVHAFLDYGVDLNKSLR